MTNKRLRPRDRKKMILAAAMTLAVKKGYTRITKTEVAIETGVVHSLINVYFPTVRILKAAVMKEAITKRIYPIIAQGLAVRDPAVTSLPLDIRKNAARWSAEGE